MYVFHMTFQGLHSSLVRHNMRSLEIFFHSFSISIRNTIAFPRNTIAFSRNNMAFSRNTFAKERNT